MAVNQNVSDLFFNHDVSEARLLDKRGNFAAWNRARLEAEALDVISCLDRLGVPGLPEPGELVDDFLARI